MIYNFTIRGDCLTLDSRISAVSGGVNCYTCRFDFDSKWDGLTKFVVFAKDEEVCTVYLDENRCTIPARFLDMPSTVTVGVYGTRLGGEPYRISTNLSHIVIKEGAYREGTAPEAPEADMWEVFFAEAEKRIRDMAEIEIANIKDCTQDAIKEYFGDIESILDEIIAEQNSLMGVKSNDY